LGGSASFCAGGIGLVISASFAGAGARTGGDTSASFGASGWAAGSTLCGAAAAKRSTNESEGAAGTVAGAAMTGCGLVSAMRVTLSAGGALKVATACGRRITGASKLALPSCG
jgi:hypothetical protein